MSRSCIPSRLRLVIFRTSARCKFSFIQLTGSMTEPPCRYAPPSNDVVTISLAPEGPLAFNSSTQVDALLSRLEKTHRRLRSVRNALLPVFRLPVEVLSSIFTYLLETPKDLFTTPRSRDVLWATHVCRHWRQVALDCSALWTRIQVQCTHPDWTAEMLRRSKRSSVSLRAKIYDPPSHTIRAVQLVLAQMGQVDEMHLSGDSKSIASLLDGVTMAAPRLTSLIVTNANWRAHADILRLNPSFLGGGAPLLQRLELQKCSVDWDAPLFQTFSNIRTLQVDGAAARQSTLPQFLHVLETAHQLEKLHLAGVIPTTPGPATFIEQTIPLNQLRRLFLGGTTSDVAALLSHITVPHTCSLSLRCVSSDKPDETTLLSDALSAHLSSAGRPAIRALHASLDAVHMHICARTRDALIETEELWDTAEPGAVYLVLAAGPEHLHTPAVLRTALQALPLRGAARMLLDDHEGLLDLAGARDVLQRMPGLVHLHARHDAASYLPLALATPRADDAAAHDRREVLAPQLETLVLEEVDGNWTVDGTPFLHALQEAQCVRTHYGQPIDALHIAHCVNVGKRDVGTLCHLFTEVDWDSFEVFVTDGDSVHDSDGLLDAEVWDDYWGYEGIHWHS